jgi:hypothetical protein
MIIYISKIVAPGQCFKIKCILGMDINVTFVINKIHYKNVILWNPIISFLVHCSLQLPFYDCLGCYIFNYYVQCILATSLNHLTFATLFTCTILLLIHDTHTCYNDFPCDHIDECFDFHQTTKLEICIGIVLG